MDQATVFNFQMFGSAFRHSPEQVYCLSSVDNGLQKKGSNNGSKVCRKSMIVKGQWNSQEDGLLVQLVKQHGDSKWSRIAEKLPGRIAKECRDRWQNHLRPDITKDAWSEEEDKLLIAIHKEVGNKWSEIARRSVLSSTSSEDQINIKQNIDKNSQVINAPMKTPLHTSFSSNVSGLFSSLTKDYSLGAVFGYITGGPVLNENCIEFDPVPSHLTTQLEFDFQKEMDFLEMLYQ
ncbi:hypothetical protein R6Q57_001378 [Mikania cordata]